MRIAVTGGSGFIGSHVVDRLIDAGHTLFVLDTRPRTALTSRTARSTCRTWVISSKQPVTSTSSST